MNTCVFTNIHDDPYIEVWLSYYSKYVDDLYVVNHGVTGDTLVEAHKKYKFTEIDDRRGDVISDSFRKDCIEYYTRAQQRKLLKKHDVVVYAHADEIIVPDPKTYRDLREYIEKMDKDYVFCTGKGVLQIDELPLDLSKPILNQRKYWWPDLAYCKPLISKVPLDWELGYHTISKVLGTDAPHMADKDLYLIHLMQADLDIYMKRSLHRHKDYFHKGAHEKEEIPERFKGLL